MDDNLSPVIVADVFEEGSGVPSSLLRFGAQVVVEPLSAGDYRISGGALIERKTVADLHGSLGRGRLWSQIGRIRDQAVLPFLFVEGADIDEGPRHPNTIRGCLLAIADLGIAVVRSSDPADTARWLYRLAVRQERRQRTAMPTPRRRAPQPGLSVLSGVPGISATTAPALLERFGSVEKLLAAGPDAWAEVNGAGRLELTHSPKLSSTKAKVVHELRSADLDESQRRWEWGRGAQRGSEPNA